jgi:hypothetical protein
MMMSDKCARYKNINGQPLCWIMGTKNYQVMEVDCKGNEVFEHDGEYKCYSYMTQDEFEELEGMVSNILDTDNPFDYNKDK